jgi:hypothetical protein
MVSIRSPITVATVCCLPNAASSFMQAPRLTRPSYQILMSSSPNINCSADDVLQSSSDASSQRRRSIALSPLVAMLGVSFCTDDYGAALAEGTLDGLVGQLKEARQQLDDIPDLIKEEKWDAGELRLIGIT